MGYLEDRFIPSDRRKHLNCSFCSRDYWLPNWALDSYSACSKECSAAIKSAKSEAKKMLPMSEFRACIACKSIFTGRYCKICSRRKAAEWKLLNPEKVISSGLEYRARNNEEIKKKKREYWDKNKADLNYERRLNRSENPEKYKRLFATRYLRDRQNILDTNRRWRGKNWSKFIAGNIAWRLANPERVRANSISYAKRNFEKIKKYKRDWQRANPGSHRAAFHNRRTRIQSVGGKLSPGLAKKLLKLQRGKCACCGQALGNSYHMDHILPIFLGGPNTDENIQLLRDKCNLTKGKKHPIDYMQSKGKLL